jgi:hypothetical protein
VFVILGAAFSWLSQKQKVVSLSSTEAETNALTEAVKEGLWILQLLREIFIRFDKPLVLHQDNQSTIALALNPVHHQRVKHFDVKCHFIRQHIEDKLVTLLYTPTGEMLADILTKALPSSQHMKLTSLLGMRSLLDLTESRSIVAHTTTWRLQVAFLAR